MRRVDEPQRIRGEALHDDAPFARVDGEVAFDVARLDLRPFDAQRLHGRRRAAEAEAAVVVGHAYDAVRAAEQDPHAGDRRAVLVDDAAAQHDAERQHDAHRIAQRARVGDHQGGGRVAVGLHEDVDGARGQVRHDEAAGAVGGDDGQRAALGGREARAAVGLGDRAHARARDRSFVRVDDDA